MILQFFDAIYPCSLATLGFATNFASVVVVLASYVMN
jgi:hypothetical protein